MVSTPSSSRDLTTASAPVIVIGLTDSCCPEAVFLSFLGKLAGVGGLPFVTTLYPFPSSAPCGVGGSVELSFRNRWGEPWCGLRL